MPDTVPYQAYRSKRHSYTLSSSNTISNASPPSPKASSAHTSKPTSPQVQHTLLDGESDAEPVAAPSVVDMSLPLTINAETNSEQSSSIPQETHWEASNVINLEDSGSSTPSMVFVSPGPPPSSSEPPPPPHRNGIRLTQSPTRKTSTFRRVPLRNTLSPLQKSPLGLTRGTASPSCNTSVASAGSRQAFSSNEIAGDPCRLSSTSSIAPLPSLGSQSSLNLSNGPPNIEDNDHIADTSVTYTPPTGAPSTPAPALQRTRIPYRPGYQSEGMSRILTDTFIALRSVKQIGEREDGARSGMKRIERNKLERRLEKLIALHFPAEAEKELDVGGSQPGAAVRAGIEPDNNRRASSFFDFDIKNMTLLDAGGLLRGVLGPREADDLRAAEQRITPWQEDAGAIKCPLCVATFHPLTTRKHHCRLCGQIVCSLPVKFPQRPETCSLLFVVDSATRKIEEVGEGVDYGVKRKRLENPDSLRLVSVNNKLAEEDKFLRGVRICRICRPILLRRQYLQEINHVPLFVKLYEIFIQLEQEIEQSLPQFQELILSLSHEDQPTKEASATRKRLLQAFSQYDELAKRIRRLPCPAGPGSSHDRVQMAVMARATLFLQKNMFPLQSLPAPKRNNLKPSPNASVQASGNNLIDPDSKLALALQPLLEQEALLESFVEEAEARRKFEDVKTLKINLGEIRTEIKKIIANAEGGMQMGRGDAG